MQLFFSTNLKKHAKTAVFAFLFTILFIFVLFLNIFFLYNKPTLVLSLSPIHLKAIMMKKILLISGLMFFLSLNTTLANSTYNVYVITLSILSYSQLPNTKDTNLCVVNNPTAHTQLQNYINELHYRYSVKTVTEDRVHTSQCNAVFFSSTSPQQQQDLLNTNQGQGILSFSTNNIDCEIGSTFCLYSTRSSSTSFKVNLDSLSRSKIRVDPRVLLLAKRAE